MLLIYIYYNRKYKILNIYLKQKRKTNIISLKMVDEASKNISAFSKELFYMVKIGKKSKSTYRLDHLHKLDHMPKSLKLITYVRYTKRYNVSQILYM